MIKALRNISLCVMLLLAFAGCDVHEFPEERYECVPFLLHLDFNTEMPLHKEVTYTRGDETKGAVDVHQLRYIINAYRIDETRGESRKADYTFVFTKSDISTLNYTACLNLPEGDYEFKVWADYVDAGSTSDKYYDTSDFSEIILANRDEHSGSNDFRDAFRGYASSEVLNPAYYSRAAIPDIYNEATVNMMRPMGKFKFLSTDVDVFLSRVAQKLYENGEISSLDIVLNSKSAYEQFLQSIKFEEYYVLFRYNIFMPCSFNMFTDKPADSWTGMSFTSRMQIEDDNTMLLGYDYIFVNGSETTLSISLEVYNNKDELISSSNPIDVPISRSKLTVVKGEFLTSKATGGVAINPGYDGDDYNIEIY